MTGTIKRRPDGRKIPAGYIVADLNASCEGCGSFIAADGPCPGVKAGCDDSPLCHSKFWGWMDQIFDCTESQQSLLAARREAEAKAE